MKVSILYALEVTSTPPEKNFFGDLARPKSKIRFWHRKDPNFTHTVHFFHGGVPSQNLEKKNVFREKGVEVTCIDGTLLQFQIV